MKNHRKALILSTALIVGATALTGCQTQPEATEQTAPSTAAILPASTGDEAIKGISNLGISPEELGINPRVLHDSHKVGFQLEPPQPGDAIAVVHTGMGDFSLRFFPDQAPKAVTNFINLAKDGRYNNTSFHRVINNFIVQGGYVGDDSGAVNGSNYYGGAFEDEFCDKLFNIRGAVSMASSRRDEDGSQFFINHTSAKAFADKGGWTPYETAWANVKSQLLSYKDSNLLSAYVDENGDKFINTDVIPEDVRALYEQQGGNPNLDGAYNAADRGNTVFAQVIDGMDVVDSIAAIETDDKNIPTEIILIKSIDITTYSGETAEPVTEPETEQETTAEETAVAE